MMTHSEYLESSRKDGPAAHRAYFGQFVTTATIARVVSAIGAERIKASTDPHMNDIPLHEWDSLVPYLPGSAGFAKVGDWYSNANGVCLAKEAARQFAESKQGA